METGTVSEKNKEIGSSFCNYSDDELILTELYIKCHSLKTQKMKRLQVRDNLSILNDNNERIYKSLLKIKNDLEVYKSNLYKTHFNLKVSNEKQKILSRKKIDELRSKQNAFKDYYKISPFKLELDELINRNKSLENELENKISLLQLTKKQYSDLNNLILETFKKKVCQFCDIILRLESPSN